MVERYREAIIVLEDNSWWTADVPESTIDEMNRAHEGVGGGYFAGRVYFRKGDKFGEDQRVKMKDMLIVEVDARR